MVLQGLAPGVQDGEEADLGTEVSSITGQRLERFGYGSKEDAVDLALVLQCEWTDRFRNREDHVEVRYGKQFTLPIVEPLGPSLALALRAVTIATGVIGNPLVPAAIASKSVTAKGWSAADRQLP